MKKLLLILLCLPMIGLGQQQTYVPDDIFEQYLINLGYDNILDDSVITANMNIVVYINVSNTNISSLVGIEDCISLTHLECYDSNISNLDLSNNLLLEFLDCDDTNLGVLDITSITLLQELFCSNTNLSSLNLSNNLHLEILNCSDNSISTLDISNNSSLTRLTCSENNLTEINLINNTALEFLSCWENSIDTLEVIANPLIRSISASRNGMKNIVLNGITSLNSLQLNENQLTNIDISNALFSGFWPEFDCSNNPQLNELDLRNGSNNYIGGVNASFCPNLTCINVDDTLYAISEVINGNWIIDSQQNFSVSCGAIFGCTDSLSCNYNFLATYDNSSCVYPVVWQQAFLVCDGDSIIVGTSVYDTTGNYIDTLSASNSCDSIVYTNISIAPPIGWQWGTSICNGDSVIVGNSIYNTVGNYTDTLSTVNGCDSIVYTNITMDYNTSSYDTLSVTTSTVWNGMPLNISGDYSVTLINSAGCDSIAYLNLTVTTTGISDIANNKSNLVKITNMLGQETPYRKNTPLFYIYDDGTVEKRIVME